jgi:hypothetical protein
VDHSELSPPSVPAAEKKPMGPKKRSRHITVFIAICSVLLVLGILYYQFQMSGKSYSGPFLPLTDEEKHLSRNLRAHIFMLADEIGERNIWHSARLHAAAEYIETTWQEQGFVVERQEYEARGVVSANLIIEMLGVSTPEQIIIVGAHYDSVLGSPGANDNGSGVGALLEISRLLKGKRLERTVRLVAFTNEEPPFFLHKNMGSRIYASRSRSRNENIVGMLSLETIGFYSEVPDSQAYPFPFSFFYPHTANFIGFVGNIRSRNLVKRSLAAFRQTTRFPSEGTAAPGWITGIGWSDHWSFWREGYRAIMVTDTAFFRYDPYHTLEDTPEKLDYERLARVTNGIAEVVAELASTKAMR